MVLFPCVCVCVYNFFGRTTGPLFFLAATFLSVRQKVVEHKLKQNCHEGDTRLRNKLMHAGAYAGIYFGRGDPRQIFFFRIFNFFWIALSFPYSGHVKF